MRDRPRSRPADSRRTGKLFAATVLLAGLALGAALTIAPADLSFGRALEGTARKAQASEPNRTATQTQAPGSSQTVSAGVRAGDRGSVVPTITLPPVLPVRSPRAPGDAAPASDLVREVRRGTEAVQPYGDGREVLFNNGFRFDPLVGEPLVPENLAPEPVLNGQNASYIVQTKGPIMAGWREQIEAAGGHVFTYLPNYAFLVRAKPEAVAGLQALGFVRWVGTFQPAYKVAAQTELNSISGPVPIVILLFPDADLAAARAAFEAMGATVVEDSDSGRNKLLRISVDAGLIPNVATRNDVAWVEPWLEQTADNAICQWVVQTNVTNSRRVWDMGIHGEGQVVHTSDSGIRTSHFQFRDSTISITDFGDYPTHRKIIAYKIALANAGILFGDTGGASYHGTHTACTFMGDDSPWSTDLRDGMALKSKIYFTDAGASANSIITPGDLNLLFQPPYDGNAGGAARVSSNSWGSAAQGAYTVTSMSVDQFLWDHKDMLILYSNGNAGPNPLTVGAPASNKNGIGTGATLNGSSSTSIASFSSRGPCADGRIKPTIMAPGNGIQSAYGGTDNTYQSLSGTSMASPAAAGAITLIRQYMTEGWYPTGVKTPGNAFVPSGSLLKAMAIASTDNDMTGQNIPNFNVGWGRIKVDNILYFSPSDSARTAVVDQTDGLLTGEYLEYQVRVLSNSKPLKIALCWFDKEGSPGAVREIVNDLDLTVTDPTGLVTYKGNVFSLGQSTTGGNRDSINVEEGVRQNIPVVGLWTIRVSGKNIPFGPQPFALAISGSLGLNAGLVQLDRTTYGRNDLIKIRVEDQDASSPITVAVSSTSESTPENVSISGADGVFEGTIATTADLAASDGMLSVSHGDAITASYLDVSNAATLNALATADFTGPLITNVAAARQGAAVQVTWNTDSPASSQVFYGTTTGLGSSSTLDPELVTSHSVVLNGLQAETVYYFDVESSDHVSNLTRDDAGGNHYLFSTGKDGDIQLIIGDESFSQDNVYLSALNNKGWQPSELKGGIIGNPVVGDRTHGMRSYSAVLWQVGFEQYPPFEDSARDSVSAYLNGGARLAVTSHDLGWAFTDVTSGFQTPARQAWIENDLHFKFLEDPATWSVNSGQASDPISGAYVGGVSYTPFRSGGAGDEIDVLPGTGTSNVTWRNNDVSPGNIGSRWESGAPNGNPLQAVWGGTPTKIVVNNYEWSQIVNQAQREDILDQTLIWLIGHDHPDAAITSPNGGETITDPSASISWTETPYGGQNIAARSLYYSSDAGTSWNLITASPGTSPYTWDTSVLPNGSHYLVRVDLSDDASPALRGSDASNAVFTINRPGGDTSGPVVVAGSEAAAPNPIDNRNPATLTARVSDATTGNSNVAAAEWSVGDSAAAAGSGTAMTGTFGTETVDVSATIAALTVKTGEQTFWVRGQDSEGNWGNARPQVFHVNGNETVAIEGSGTLHFELEQNRPNPTGRGAATVINFTIPVAERADLAIYNVRGQKVRTLLSGRVDAGRRAVTWDGRTDAGRLAGSGVYFYKLTAGPNQAIRKLVWMD